MTNIVVYEKIGQKDSFLMTAVKTQFFDVPIFSEFKFIRGESMPKIEHDGPTPSFMFKDVKISLDQQLPNPDLTGYKMSFLDDIDVEAMNEHLIKSHLKQCVALTITAGATEATFNY